MRGAIPLLPNTPSWHGAELKKAQGQIYLTFTFTFSALSYCALLVNIKSL